MKKAVEGSKCFGSLEFVCVKKLTKELCVENEEGRRKTIFRNIHAHRFLPFV